MREKMESMSGEANHYIRYLELRYDEMVDRLKRGDELPAGSE